ncbi:MAG: squalene synthase HpnD, partial [Bacteroidetes bacterium]|nr:squalene synthase HpnD [Bacteroidota bacterium]
LEDKPALFAARAMQRIYSRMLNKIVDAEYNIYEKDISVSFFEKLGISLGAWAKYSLVYS